eukprot:IDg15051t1
MATQRTVYNNDAFTTASHLTALRRNDGTTATWNNDVGWSVCFPDDIDGERDAAPERSEDTTSALREAAADLRTSPDEVLSKLTLAAARAVEALAHGDDGANYPRLPVARENRLLPRIFNLTPLTPMRSMRAASVGTFVAVRGTIVRVSNIRQQVVSMRFECSKCATEQLVPFPDFKYTVPTACPTSRCRGRAFEPLRDSAETIDWQKIRIQEIQDRDAHNREEGRMPRTLDAELFSDLIDTCIPGDIVVVNGVVRVLTLEGVGSGKNARNANCLYYMYIEANSIANPRAGSDVPGSSGSVAGYQLMEVETMQMQQLIRNVLQHEDPFSFLVQSAVPSIFGHEMVKAGMLCLCWWCEKHR